MFNRLFVGLRQDPPTDSRPQSRPVTTPSESGPARTMTSRRGDVNPATTQARLRQQTLSRIPTSADALPTSRPTHRSEIAQAQMAFELSVKSFAKKHAYKPIRMEGSKPVEMDRDTVPILENELRSLFSFTRANASKLKAIPTPEIDLDSQDITGIDIDGELKELMDNCNEGIDSSDRRYIGPEDPRRRFIEQRNYNRNKIPEDLPHALAYLKTRPPSERNAFIRDFTDGAGGHAGQCGLDSLSRELIAISNLKWGRYVVDSGPKDRLADVVKEAVTNHAFQQFEIFFSSLGVLGENTKLYTDLRKDFLKKGKASHGGKSIEFKEEGYLKAIYRALENAKVKNKKQTSLWLNGKSGNLNSFYVEEVEVSAAEIATKRAELAGAAQSEGDTDGPSELIDDDIQALVLQDKKVEVAAVENKKAEIAGSAQLEYLLAAEGQNVLLLTDQALRNLLVEAGITESNPHPSGPLRPSVACALKTLLNALHGTDSEDLQDLQKVLMEGVELQIAQCSTLDDMHQLMSLLPEDRRSEVLLRPGALSNPLIAQYVVSNDFTKILAGGSAENFEKWVSAVNPDADALGKVSIHAANAQNQNLIAVMLQKNQFDLEAKDETGLSVLHCAARNGDIELINKIKGHPRFAELCQVETDKGHIPLHFAVSSNQMPVLDAVLEATPKWPAFKSKQTPLHLAMEAGNIDMCFKLLGRMPKNFAKATFGHGNTLLHEAARIGLSDLFPALVALGSDISKVNSDRETPLLMALRYIGTLNEDTDDNKALRTKLLGDLDVIANPSLFPTKDIAYGVLRIRHQTATMEFVNIKDMRFAEKWLKKEHINVPNLWSQKLLTQGIANSMTESLPILKFLFEHGVDLDVKGVYLTPDMFIRESRPQKLALSHDLKDNPRPALTLGLLGAYSQEKEVPEKVKEFNKIYTTQRSLAEIEELSVHQAKLIFNNLNRHFNSIALEANPDKLEALFAKEMKGKATILGKEMISFAKKALSIPEYVSVNSLYPINNFHPEIKKLVESSDIPAEQVDSFMSELPDFRSKWDYKLDSWPS